MIRLFDFVFSFLGLILLFPLFFIIFIWIKLDSKGTIFYKQVRVGKNNQDFSLYKFRSMKINADKNGFLTIGEKDNRITKSGYYLRKYKIDELPQLINVFIGNMSLVGPRPEVRKYVDLYSDEQRKVLLVKPGITDYASIEYVNENELLAESEEPETTYIKEIMPEKIKLNMKYINNQSVNEYFKIILLTISHVFFK